MGFFGTSRPDEYLEIKEGDILNAAQWKSNKQSRRWFEPYDVTLINIQRRYSASYYEAQHWFRWWPIVELTL